MYRSLTLSLILLFSLAGTHAQVVKIKKDNVLLNGTAILKYNKINLAQVSFYSLNGDELLFYQTLEHCYGQRADDDCMVLNFVTAKIKFRVSDWSRIASLGVNNAMEKLIRWLVQDKVLSETGELNLEKLALFRDKYEDTRPLN